MTSRIHFEKNALANAPTHIKPRMSETQLSQDTYDQIQRHGKDHINTDRDHQSFRRLDTLPALIKDCMITNAAMTIA